MTRITTALTCLLIAGCGPAEFIHGDAFSDTRPDTGHDTRVDSSWDTYEDPGHDWGVDTGWDTGMPCPAPDPYPHGPEISWTVDDTIWPVDDGLDLSCMVDGVWEDGEGSWTIDLSCHPGPGTVELHTLYIHSDPRIWLYLEPGTMVELQYYADEIWWVNRWFVLRHTYGELILAGVDAEYLTPWGDAYEWLYPVGAWILEGMCEPEPADCGHLERRALEVDVYGETGTVYDSTHDFVGSLLTAQVLVAEATSYLEMECDDVPDEWVSALIYLLPEG